MPDPTIFEGPNAIRPPRRAFFQVHLSTAIVLMFVAGGLIWANVRCVCTDEMGVMIDHRFEEFRDKEVTMSALLKDEDAIQFFGTVTNKYGFPLAFLESNQIVGINNKWDKRPAVFDSAQTWHGSAIALDSAFALAILVAVWFGFEMFLRRRRHNFAELS